MAPRPLHFVPSTKALASDRKALVATVFISSSIYPPTLPILHLHIHPLLVYLLIRRSNRDRQNITSSTTTDRTPQKPITMLAFLLPRILDCTLAVVGQIATYTHLLVVISVSAASAVLHNEILEAGGGIHAVGPATCVVVAVADAVGAFGDRWDGCGAGEAEGGEDGEDGRLHGWWFGRLGVC